LLSRSLPHYVSFFFTDTAPPETYTLSLHDALPIFTDGRGAMPRFRTEMGPFIGFQSGGRLAAVKGGFGTAQEGVGFYGGRRPRGVGRAHAWKPSTEPNPISASSF